MLRCLSLVSVSVIDSLTSLIVIGESAIGAISFIFIYIIIII